jgi:preprotein translocase subunit SecD
MGRAWGAIAAVLIAISGCRSKAADTPYEIQFRLAGGQGSSETRTTTMVIDGTRERVIVERTPRFTEADLDSVWIEEDPRNPGRYAIAVCFKSTASDLLRLFTSDHIGERLAIIVDDRLTAAPVITEPLGGERLPVVTNLSRDDAEDLLEDLAPRVRPTVPAP